MPDFHEQPDFVLGKGKIIIDGDVVKILTEEEDGTVIRTLEEVKEQLLTLSDDQYAHIVPVNTGAERAALLPKTDVTLEIRGIKDKSNKAVFDVIIAEKDGARPNKQSYAMEKLKERLQSNEPLSIEEIGLLAPVAMSMEKIVELDDMWEFFKVLKKTLGFSDEHLELLYKEVPSDYGRQKRTRRRDYLELLTKIWPTNKLLLNAIAAFRREEGAKSKERKTERKSLKQWQTMSSGEKLEDLKTHFPQEYWDKIHDRDGLLLFMQDIKERYGIGQFAFQSFISDIAPERGQYYKIPGGPSTALTMDRFSYFYELFWKRKD